MTKFSEDRLEQLCLEWFQSCGYDYSCGPDIAPDGITAQRNDHQQVILQGCLITALQKINPHIPLETLEEAALAITKPESPVLIHNNRAFHRLLLEGAPVEYRDGDETKTDHVQLIDFHNVENNQFLVVTSSPSRGWSWC